MNIIIHMQRLVQKHKRGRLHRCQPKHIVILHSDVSPMAGEFSTLLHPFIRSPSVRRARYEKAKWDILNGQAYLMGVPIKVGSVRAVVGSRP